LRCAHRDLPPFPTRRSSDLGGGEMAERIRGFDWASTPAGPASTWSPALRITTQILLASPVPHILWWGPEHIQLYNDACRPIFGRSEEHTSELQSRENLVCRL